MALFLSDVVLSLLDSADIYLQQRSQIQGITVDTTIEENYEDTLEITDQPVEVNAVITDHSYKRPMVVMLRCGWSDSNPLAAIQALQGGPLTVGSSTIGSNVASSFTGGAMAASDYVAGIYSQLLSLQESRQPFIMTTGMRTYDSMLIETLYVRRDQRTRFVLACEATCRQVIIVDTQTTTLPPQANQKTPANTAEVVNGGTVAPQQGTPAPGGSLPSSSWTVGPP